MSKLSPKFNTGLKLLTVASFLVISSGQALASVITNDKVIELVNQSRQEKGLNLLVENSQLNQAAKEKALDMIENNYFAHTSPKGITPWYWIEKSEYIYINAGENLAISFKNAEKEHEAWMKSEKHRQNILSDKFQEIGVAVEKGNIDGKETIVTVQMFGSRDGFVASQKIEIKEIKTEAKEEVLGANDDVAVSGKDLNDTITLINLVTLEAATVMGIIAVMGIIQKRREESELVEVALLALIYGKR